MTEQSAIVTINEEGVIQSIDKSGCALFGYELAELIGHDVTKLIPSPYREQHDSYLRNYKRTGKQKIIGKVLCVGRYT